VAAFSKALFMNHDKRKKLQKKGFHIGSVQEFLKLSREETVSIELKLTSQKCSALMQPHNR
jgi:hypothetical protein